MATQLVSSKAIERVSLHSKARFVTRFDVFPFLCAYASVFYLYAQPQSLQTALQPCIVWTLPSLKDSPTLTSTDTYSNVAFGFFLALLFAHAFTELSCFWSLKFRCWVSYRTVKDIFSAECVLIIPPPHCGASMICPLITEQLDDDHKLSFEFQKIKYVYNSKMKIFEQLDYPVDESIRFYTETKGYADKESLTKAFRKYGKNEFDIPMPEFMELFKEHATAPFFIFQICCVGLWCMDEYWRYSLFTLAMLVFFEAVMVKQRIKNMQQILEMRTSPHNLFVYRENMWIIVKSSELLPGDLMSIAASKDDDVCSCDILLLKGNCVVNEALLTGESIPQVKESLDDTHPEESLELSGKHKYNLVSGGCQILQTTVSTTGVTVNCNIKSPPDGGAIGLVLQTGFSTSQGKLLRTILFSTERVTVNNSESLLFILFLLCFAVVAAGYTLKKGLEDETRSRYKLLLNCIMIVTSVVPPELPMELSLAVNTSLAQLRKRKIFCTEAFRIPFAGRITWCCFDKTGTLTSDAFNMEGIGGIPDAKNAGRNDGNIGSTTGLIEASLSPLNTQYVIAGCHSLSLLNNEVIGDPLEKAAMEAIKWTFAKDVASSPGGRSSVRVCLRHPFLSDLKRMACIVKVTTHDTQRIVTVCKGAAEVMSQRFKTKPSDYDKIHRDLSQQGCRVLALGHKQMPFLAPRQMKQLPREEVERDLEFDGFLVLRCPMKPDSLETVKALRLSCHNVIMITGDHALTACSVATDLLISVKSLLILTHHGPKAHDSQVEWINEDEEEEQKFHTMTWCSLDGTTNEPFFPFDFHKTKKLFEEHDFCIPGDALAYLRESAHEHEMTNEDICMLIPLVKVYARMSPYQKEFVMTTLKNLGEITMMCGDGTNDVGALKQAHVGVALISLDEKIQNARMKRVKAQQQQPKNKSRKSKSSQLQSSSSNGVGSSNTRRSSKKQRKLKPGTAGDPRPSQKAKKADPRENSKKNMEALQTRLKSMEEEEPRPVRLGDASIASPFTSKVPFVNATLHIIRQGRCTLVTTFQMYQILALNCLISAYSLSALYVDGVKLGDTQATVSGISIAALFLFITRSKPVEKLSSQRPRSSIFTVYMFFSVIGQFLIHFAVLVTAVQWANPLTPTDEETRDPDGEFAPNVLNTVVYLVSMLMTVATFATNYIGRPFMESLTENKALYRTLLASLIFVFVCIFDVVPGLNEAFELVVLPSVEFQSDLCILLIGDLVGVFLYERLVRWLCTSHTKPDAEFVRKLGEIDKKDK